MGNAKGGISGEAWDQLNRVYDELDYLIDLIGLEYTADTNGYICDPEQVEEAWCDEELLDSIDALHSDLGYFLGK